MSGSTGLFAEEPADTREAIMKATYDALVEHGYADLTIQRIGDEFGKSKSLLYHHYDSKDALLLDFLTFMLERMAENVPLEDPDSADDRLFLAFEHTFDDLLGPERKGYVRAMTELRAQAASDEDFRRQFTKNDQYVTARIAEIIEEGIETGIFRDVDTERVASTLHTIITGAIYRRTTTEDTDVEGIREELRTYVRLRLLAEE